MFKIQPVVRDQSCMAFVFVSDKFNAKNCLRLTVDIQLRIVCYRYLS